MVIEQIGTGNEALEKYAALRRLHGHVRIHLKNEQAKSALLEQAKGEMESAYLEQKVVSENWKVAYINQHRCKNRWRFASLMFGGIMVGSILAR